MSDRESRRERRREERERDRDCDRELREAGRGRDNPLERTAFETLGNIEFDSEQRAEYRGSDYRGHNRQLRDDGYLDFADPFQYNDDDFRDLKRATPSCEFHDLDRAIEEEIRDIRRNLSRRDNDRIDEEFDEAKDKTPEPVFASPERGRGRY